MSQTPPCCSFCCRSRSWLALCRTALSCVLAVRYDKSSSASWAVRARKSWINDKRLESYESSLRTDEQPKERMDERTDRSLESERPLKLHDLALALLLVGDSLGVVDGLLLHAGLVEEPGGVAARGGRWAAAPRALSGPPAAFTGETTNRRRKEEREELERKETKEGRKEGQSGGGRTDDEP